MSKFNTKRQPATVINLAGGSAHPQSAPLEFVSILLTSFVKDEHYRKANDTLARLKELIAQCDKEFVAKALVYARNEFGMRSISHVGASELAKYITGTPWGKAFYKAIIRRPDDILEILTYHKANNGKITNTMKDGLAKAFDKFDAYQLAKYRGEGKSLTLWDAVRICHPVPVERNKEAIAGLKAGTLKNTDTWESKLSEAGQKATNEDEKLELKKDAWVELIKTKKIAYFALLRNLRNILEQAPEAVPGAVEMLTDEKLIKKSLVLPFRFLTAYEEMEKLTLGKAVREIVIGLNKAIDISIANVPVFEGETCVVLDTSTSMKTPNNVVRIGALFAAAIAKKNNADAMTFDTDARYVSLNTMDSLTTLSNQFAFNGGGTNFHSIFARLNKKYDRIIILSDMQGWVGHNTPSRAFTQYKQATGANPNIYSFDLKNYGDMQFPERNVYCVAGYSDKVFDIMKVLEQDKNALINTIKQTKF